MRILPQKWAIRFAVEGDLRFLSHHDMMRAMERLLARASLPMRYSEGFNPRPAMSLACPRPVGVAGLDDLLVIRLVEPLGEEQLLQRLNEQAPPGMKFLSATELTAKGSARPMRMDFRTPIDPQCLDALRRRLDELKGIHAWQVERAASPKGRTPRPSAPRVIDLKPLVPKLEICGGWLHMSLVCHGDMWARPGEVFRLLGLDERVSLAQTVRTSVEYAA